jgi:hypothetical protein
MPRTKNILAEIISLADAKGFRNQVDLGQFGAKGFNSRITRNLIANVVLLFSRRTVKICSEAKKDLPWEDPIQQLP